jgi:hypothetical protein
LLASTATATDVAMALRTLSTGWGRLRFRCRPGGTVVQDLLSIIIYFAVAVALAP